MFKLLEPDEPETFRGAKATVNGEARDRAVIARAANFMVLQVVETGVWWVGMNGI